MLSFILNVFVQSFIMLSVVILSVVAPLVLAYQEITQKALGLFHN